MNIVHRPSSSQNGISNTYLKHSNYSKRIKDKCYSGCTRMLNQICNGYRFPYYLDPTGHLCEVLALTSKQPEDSLC